jgi:hypothetical protein
MPWTPQEESDLFDAYWKGEADHCPQCRAILNVGRMDLSTGYRLRIECPRRCGRMEKYPANDPRKGDFRDWTEAEGRRLIDLMLENGVAECPIDGTRVNISQLDFANGSNEVRVSCPRCQAGYFYRFPPK